MKNTHKEINQIIDVLRDADAQDNLPSLQDIISVMPGIVYWKSTSGMYLGCNDNAAQLVGYNSPLEVVGKHLRDLAPPEVAERVALTDQNVMDCGLEYCCEEQTRLPNGSEAIFLSRKVPMKNAKGKVIGLLGISIDITERIRHERELLEAKEAVEHANAVKSQFILNMSHDIRTPFTGVLGLSQFLAENEPDPEKKELLDTISQSAESLLSLVNEVMEMAPMEQHIVLEKTTFSLTDVLKDIYYIIKPTLSDDGPTFHFSCDDAVPATVNCNHYAVKRILLNLVSNAIKFTKEGKIEVHCSLGSVHNSRAQIVMTVSDTGIGIDPEEHQHIFDQFHRLTPSYASPYDGSGIGLWLVKKLVHQINGTVSVDSAPGSGSVFKVTFPVSLTPED